MGCLDTCLGVSKRISVLDNYFIQKKCLKLAKMSVEKPFFVRIFVSICCFKTWNFLLYSLENASKWLYFVWIFLLIGKKHVNLIYYKPMFGYAIFNFAEDKCIKDKCIKASVTLSGRSRLTIGREV